MARIAVCTTYGDIPHPRYWMSLLGLQGTWTYKPIRGKQGVDAGHQALIEWFLGERFEWMLHVDADAVLHPRTLNRLIGHGEPFVSALAFQRKPPYLPVCYTMGEDRWRRQWQLVRDWLFDHFEEINVRDRPFVLTESDLTPVDRGGAHCLLTHRSVFEAIEPPWFVRSGGYSDMGSGSDFYFYQQAIEAGFTPKVDLGTIAGHLCGDWCVGPIDFLAWDSVSEMSEGGDKIEFNFRRIVNGAN